MITYSAADREWFEREVGGSLTISPAELVFLSEQSDLSHDLAQLDAMCAKPAPEYQPDRQEALSVAKAQQQMQRIKHYGPPQGRTIPLSTVVFILTCCAFGALVALLELVGRSIQ